MKPDKILKHKKVDLSQEISNIENKVEVDSKKNKKRVIIRTAVRFLLFAVISFMIGTSFYKINARKLMHDEMPMIFGYSSAVVLSGSMEPTLSIDDLIFVKKFDDKDYKVDDIIVFQQGRSCTVHRIKSINEDGTLTTQGDANNAEDEPVEYKQVKGKVIFSISSVGKVVDIIKNPIVVIAFVVIIFFLVERSYKKDGASEKSETELLKEEIELLKMQKEIDQLKKEKEQRQKEKSQEDSPSQQQEDLSSPQQQESSSSQQQEDNSSSIE